jgi:hypothetical protein
MSAFCDLIDAIENEIKHAYLPGAIQWADSYLDNAWSKAMNEFEEALKTYRDWEDKPRMDAAARIYKAKCLEMIGLYRESRREQKSGDLFGYLKQAQGGT